MATSPNLAIPHLTQASNQKHVLVNDAINALDSAITEDIAQAVSDGGDTTVATADALGNLFFDLTGALTGARNVILPTANKKAYWVRDSTTGGHDVTVKTSAGAGVVAPKALWALLYVDGTDVTNIQGGGAGGLLMSSLGDTNIVTPAAGEILRWDASDWVNEEAPLDIGATFNGILPDNQTVLRVPMTRAMTFPTTLTGSKAILGTAATAETDFDVRQADADGTNETSEATIRFAISGKEATFILAAPLTFAVGEILIVRAPGTADATAADLGFILSGKRD